MNGNGLILNASFLVLMDSENIFTLLVKVHQLRITASVHISGAKTPAPDSDRSSLALRGDHEGPHEVPRGCASLYLVDVIQQHIDLVASL